MFKRHRNHRSRRRVPLALAFTMMEFRNPEDIMVGPGAGGKFSVDPLEAMACMDMAFRTLITLRRHGTTNIPMRWFEKNTDNMAQALAVAEGSGL